MHYLAKIIGLVLFFCGIALLVMTGTEGGQEALAHRAEHLPSSTRLIQSGWWPMLLSFSGMCVYLVSVVKEKD